MNTVCKRTDGQAFDDAVSTGDVEAVAVRDIRAVQVDQDHGVVALAQRVRAGAGLAVAVDDHRVLDGRKGSGWLDHEWSSARDVEVDCDRLCVVSLFAILIAQRSEPTLPSSSVFVT